MVVWSDPLLKDIPQINFVTSLLLARNFLLASLFSFQGASVPTSVQGQIEMLGLLPKHFDMILWWR